MWGTFLIAVVAAAGVLFAPGYCLLRALGYSRLVSAAAAPLVGCCALCATGTAFTAAGIPCTAATLSAALLVACAVGLAICHLRTARKAPQLDPLSAGTLDIGGKTLPFDATVLAASLAFGIFVCAFVFIPCLTGSPDALFCRWDNQTHLNTVRAFLDSDTWSVLRNGMYLGADRSAVPYTGAGGSGFYPTGWHIACAFTANFAGASVPLAANALNATISALVYPVGMFLLNKALFPQNRRALAGGIVLAMAFTAFPWGLFVKGPLYPNLLAFALLPSFLSIVILHFEQGLVRAKLPGFILFCLAAFFSLAVTQTNALFAAFLFLAAYGGHYFNELFSRKGWTARKRTAAIAAYALLIVVLWAVLYSLPFMENIVSYDWTAITSFPFALLMAGSFAMPSFWPEPLLAFAALVGLIWCVRRRKLWILVPALVMMLGFALDRGTSGILKHIVTGFWYTDPFRVAALYAIFAVPVACLGFAALMDWLQARGFRFLRPLRAAPVLFCALMLVFCAITYWPTPLFSVAGHDVKTGFSTLHSRFLASYRTDMEQVYSTEERAFVEKALNEIPEGSLVVNQPNDGSVFAYATDDMNLYYRSCKTGRQTDASRAIRLSLDEFATNDEVKKAVEETGAEYVLQLDQGVSYQDGLWLPQYSEEGTKSWTGIDGIDDDTPGFTVVLAEGDMRLYRIG